MIYLTDKVTGALIGAVQGTSDDAEANIPLEYVTTKLERPSTQFRYANGSWIFVGEAPTIFHEYNVASAGWEITYAADYVRNMLDDIAVQKRDTQLNEGFIFNSHSISTDALSRQRIYDTVHLNEDTIWTDTAGNLVPLTPDDLAQLRNSLASFVNSIFMTSNAIRDKIKKTNDLDELLLIYATIK